jgi:hypothetical protein
MVSVALNTEQSHGKSQGLARFAGSGIAGFCELTLFHPVDTIAKRLMNSKEDVCKENYKRILFQKAANEGPLRKYSSLFGGFGYGALYKVSQRIYKFGGQPVFNDFLTRTVFASSDGNSSKATKFWSNAISGALMGACEIVLLPFDVMKIKSQTNPEIRKIGLSGLIKQEGIAGLYAGASYTAARNVCGSFMLFGVNSYVRAAIAEDSSNKKPSLLHLTISSTAGSVSCILVSCPLDVVKTRIQSGSHSGLTGSTIIKNIYNQEGFGGFFKGAVPKVAVVGPKLIFSFTLAQYLIHMFSQ